MIKTLTVSAFALAAALPAFAQEQGGKLTVPIITATFVEDFNPFSNAQEDLVRGTMFEPLWAHNVMQGDIAYRLATGFAYADDLMSMTITLRDDLTWSDGEVLDADDVAYSLNLGNEDPTLDKTGKWSDGLIASVEVVDPLTVKINFSRADSTLDWYLEQAYIVPQHVWQDVEDKITFKNTNPVGSGPVTEVVTMRVNQVEICRNPNYYKADEGLPFLDCIKFRQYSDNSQIQPALMAGEIDWGSNFIADIESTYVARDPDNHGFWYPANDIINLYMNTRKAPFDNLDFRRALSMALDREAIVDLAAYGYPTVAKHATGIGEYYAASFNDEVNANYDQFVQYDPEAAMALLDAAGYVDADGDGFRDNPDGTPIDFNIDVVNGWTDWVQSVQMVSEYLAEVGIKANTKTIDWSVYDTALKEGIYDVSINWSVVNVDPIQAYNAYFHPSQVGLSWHANHGFASDAMGALIDEYGQTTDMARRTEILAELMTYTGDNMPFVPLFSNPTWYQYNATRIGGWPTEADPFVQPVFYSIGRKLITFERLYAK
jgi:peptide/nickel transport system substrate-binding protein